MSSIGQLVELSERPRGRMSPATSKRAGYGVRIERAMRILLDSLGGLDVSKRGLMERYGMSAAQAKRYRRSLEAVQS